MKSVPLLLSLLTLGFLSSAGAATLLDDHFTDGSRTNQNLPTSAAYYFGATSGNVSIGVAGNALQLSYATSANMLSQVVAYFTNSGSPVTLAVGDKLSASMVFSADAISTTSDTLRIGLFNSGGSRVSADYTGVADAAFNAYSGYSFFTNIGTGSSNGTIRQRTGTNNTLYSSSANTNLRSGLAPLGYTADTNYTLTFELEYLSASNMRVTFSDSNGALYTTNDTVSPFTSFDTFGLFLANGEAVPQTYLVDDVLITYTPVPEPTMLFLPGLMALLLFHRNRRQAAPFAA